MTIDEFTRQIAGAIIRAAKAKAGEEGADVMMVIAGRIVESLLREIEIQAQRETGYHVGWLEIIGDYVGDRLRG